MNVMTKRGSQDNVVTYEHYCDTKEDLTAIPNDQITLGSTAVVLKDEGDAMEVYMANSSKEWIPFSSVGNAGDSSGGGGSTGGVMVVHTTYDETTNTTALDHTWQEIYDAMKSGMLVMVNIVKEDELNTFVSNNWVEEARVGLGDFSVNVDEVLYSTTSSDGYPAQNVI